MSESVTARAPWTAGLRDAFVAFRAVISTFPLSLIQLAMRISVGFVFFNSGLLKLRSFEFAVKLFQDEYRLPLLDPALAAQLAMTVEIVVPLFLFAGLATRLATLPLLGMVAVIEILVYPLAWVEHLPWVSTLALLLTRGPGVFSLDHLIDRYFERPSSKRAPA